MELISPEIRPTRESETRARLFSLFEQVNTQLYEMGTAAPGALTPETTLIVCHVKRSESGKYLYWASFGDSFLFVLRSGQLRQINSLHPRWLGYLSKLSEGAESRAVLMRLLTDKARYMGVANGLETGIEKLESGDVIFLCTDGLVGSDTAPDPSVLTGITQILTSDITLDSKVEKVITLALQRGEKDNVSCGMASIS
jgi:serine/threonine protein phosphatase PrpC